MYIVISNSIVFLKHEYRYLFRVLELNRYGARFGCERLRVRVPSVPMLLWKLSVLEIPLDKELTANRLVETRTKLEELIPAEMVKYGLNRVQLPLWSKQSLILTVSHGMVVLGHSGQRTYVKCAEAAWNCKAGA